MNRTRKQQGCPVQGPAGWRDWASQRRSPLIGPPHCHIPVGLPRGDPGPREGAPCCPLRSLPGLGLDSEELGESHLSP